jgi:A/G-specific adenine glycosylase
VISEVLLQRTRADVVAKFMPLFLERFPCWRELADAKDSDLQSLLGPLGLWRRRANSLKALAREMERRHGRFPNTREEVETLPGVGQYVGSAILLFSHGAQEPLLDVNMARVLERFFGPRDLVDIRYDPWLQALARCVVKHEKAADVNWAILDLAAKICVVGNPRCELCPLHRSCRHALGSARVK